MLVFAQANPEGNQYQHTYASLADFPKSIGIDLQETLIAPGLREAGAVSKDKELLKNACNIGERMAKNLRMAKIMKKPDAISGPSKLKRPRS